MQLKEEDDLAAFLCVIIKKPDRIKIELTQTGLIKRILEAMGIEDANSKTTPSQTWQSNRSYILSWKYYRNYAIFSGSI